MDVCNSFKTINENFTEYSLLRHNVFLFYSIALPSLYGWVKLSATASLAFICATQSYLPNLVGIQLYISSLSPTTYSTKKISTIEDSFKKINSSHRYLKRLQFGE